MAEFVCRLGTPGGEIVTRTVEAVAANEVRTRLEREGFKVFAITPPKGDGLAAFTKGGGTGRATRVKANDFLLFNQQLAALLRAGISDVLADGQPGHGRIFDSLCRAPNVGTVRRLRRQFTFANPNSHGYFRMADGQYFLGRAVGDCGRRGDDNLVTHTAGTSHNRQLDAEDSSGGKAARADDDGPGRALPGHAAGRRHHAGRIVGDRG